MCCGKSLKLCLTLWNPIDYSPPGVSVHGILQARILEWVAISFSTGVALGAKNFQYPAFSPETVGM